MTPDQLRSARQLLGWSQQRLATWSGTSAYVIAFYEQRGRVPVGYPLASTIDPVIATRIALEAAGIEFSNGQPAGAQRRGVYQ